MATKQQQIDFINYIAPIIKKVGNERGYRIVSPFIAMACKEGNFGQSKLAKNYSNHFGMKAGSSWKGKVVNMKTMEEYTVGKLTQIVDGFRVYEGTTKEQADINGVHGFFDFISTKRYAKVKEESNKGTPLTVLQAIKNAGYATSSTYVNSCMNDYIKKFNLQYYDMPDSPVETTTTKPVNELPLLKLGVKDTDLGGAYVESWQNYLKLLKLYNGKITGVFDTDMYYSVREYQRMKGLSVDGIIGKKTWATIPIYD